MAPYDDGAAGDDWSTGAARLVIEELMGRSGIDHALGDIDHDVRVEIVQSLSGVIRKAVIGEANRGPLRGRPPKIDRAACARLYAEGWTIKRLAKEYGVTDAAVISSLKAAGVLPKAAAAVK